MYDGRIVVMIAIIGVGVIMWVIYQNHSIVANF